MATNNTRQKAPRYSTPKGRFSFPKLTTPDTKFKPEGEYSVGLRFDANDPQAVKLKAFIDAEAAKSLATAKENAKNPAEAKKWETKYLPYKMVEDKETGEETGEIEFKFTMKASGVRKDGTPWEQKPQLFDAFGTNVTTKGEALKIGGGTTGIIAYTVQPYAATVQSGASVKLALQAVQIIELKQFGGANGSADSFGFAKQEGFTADGIEEDVIEEDTSTDAPSDQSEDF